MAVHEYEVEVSWTGNLGRGTAGYRDYSRDHLVGAGDAPTIPASSDPAFRGDPKRWNPEQLLVASLSQCHMLWYLHLCAEAGVVVESYRDTAHGTLDGERFVQVVLRPRVTVADAATVGTAQRLHAQAHAKCFIANSVNFPVAHEPVVQSK